MKAKEIIRKKYGTKGFEPMWLTLDIKEIVWLMKKYHKQQLKILNIQSVSVSDSDIDEHANNYDCDGDRSDLVQAFMAGAKWMRNKLKNHSR